MSLLARSAFLFAFVLILLSPVKAGAGPVDEAFSGFTSSSYDTIEKAVETLAASGHPTAEAMLRALGGGNLLVREADKAILYKTQDGKVLDARTGQAVGGAGVEDLKPVRVNNRIRRAATAALGSLTLLNPKVEARRAAAESVFKSRDIQVLAHLEAVLAKEKDAGVRKVMEQARAALVLAGDGPEAAKLAAVEVVAGRGDLEARAMLASLGANVPPAVAKAAADAVAAIDSRLAVWTGAQSVYYGISLGSVLLLAAIGLAITFGVMGVINMAHGEMVMLGAYTTFVVQETIRNSAPQLFEVSLLIAVPLAFLVAGAIGILIERSVIRFLYGRPLETLLATWGISLVLQQGVRSIFGPSNREVGTPAWMSGAFELGGLTLTYNRLSIIVFAGVVLAVLILVMRYTPFGLRMRAVTQNRQMAASMGIRTPWIDSLTFGLGSGIAGIAGVALSQIDNVSPNLGQSYIIDSFMVVVFGGVGNLWGTLVAALSLGVANKLLEPFAGAVLGKILILVFIILFIQKRPRGLFALRGRAVES
jgi:urea transport system permease protein